MYLHTHSPNVITPFRPVSSQGHVTVRAMQLLFCSSACIGGILLRTHVCHCTHIGYKQRKCCCDPTVNYWHLTSKQCTFFAISRLSLEGFLPEVIFWAQLNLLQTIYCTLRLVYDYIRGRQICNFMFCFSLCCSLKFFQL